MAKELGLSPDCPITLEVQAGQLIVRPMLKKYNLTELLAKVTPDNVHPETDWGGTAGKEVW
jgi:antitoxin MazE